MKSLFTILFIGVFFSLQSQTSDENIDKWDKHTNPTTGNFFYHHFKKNLTDQLISQEKFSTYKTKIIVEFNLDKDYNIVNLRTNAKYPKLKERILIDFSSIPVVELALKEASELHNYSFQIIASKNGKGFLKCSSSVLNEYPPIMEGCEQEKNYKLYTKCFFNKIYYNIQKDFDTTTYKRNKPLKNLKVNAKFYINEKGKIEISKVTSKDSSLIKGVTAVLNNFKPRFLPAKQNRKIDKFGYEITIQGKDIYSNGSSYFDNNTSTENDLAIHFKNYLDPLLINQEALTPKKRSVQIHFSTTKNNELLNVSTNAKNKDLNEQIVHAFKLYPFEKLNITETNDLYRYIITVLVLEKGESIIKCSNEALFETLPVLKGCKKSKTFTALKKCNNESMQQHVKSRFNSSLASNLGLQPGIARIYCRFKISKTGTITDIQVRAPHEDLKGEAKRVLKTLKVLSPGYQRGKPVNVGFSLPIAFKVVDSPKTPFSHPRKNNIRTSF